MIAGVVRSPIPIAVLAASCISCTGEGPRVLVGVPGGSARALRVEVSLLGSCDDVAAMGDDPLGALRTVEIGEGGAEPLGKIAPGTYGLYGRAWETECVLYAAGCAAVEITADTPSIAVELVRLDRPRGCGLGERCVNDLCESEVVPGLDAGADAEIEADAEAPRECGETAPCTSAFTDDFDDDVVGSGWVAGASQGCTILEDDGEAIFIPPMLLGEYGFCALTSAAVYELDGDSVTVEVAQATSAVEQAETFLSVSRVIAADDAEDVLVMSKSGPNIVFLVVRQPVRQYEEVGRIAYDPVRHRWWRIREDDGTVFWETSPDGRAWTSLESDPGPFPLERVLMSIGAGTNSWTEDGGSAHFDNFNFPPE